MSQVPLQRPRRPSLFALWGPQKPGPARLGQIIVRKLRGGWNSLSTVGECVMLVPIASYDPESAVDIGSSLLGFLELLDNIWI